jgi:pimeloyl-ACP methyl ester carboxylesterase
MRYIAQGYPVYCTTGGRPLPASPTGPVVVMVHGAGMDASVWQWQARALAHRGHAVLVPELPAHGRSPGLPRTSVPALAEWLHALLDAAHVTDAVLVGHSLGSLIALEAARTRPPRISGLILLGCAVPMPVGAQFLDATAATIEAGWDMQTLWSHAPKARLGASSIPGTYLPLASKAIVRSADPGVQHAGLAACNAYQPDGWQAIKGKPILVIAGSRDQMTPLRACQQLAKAVEGEIKVVDAGHSMMSEQPRAVLELIAGRLGIR